jgi:hypothetical protein
MKIEETTVTKLIITDVSRLDPIAVYLEDHGPRQGKITITCFNESWSYYWGAMGEGYDIRRFFLTADVDYLATKLRGTLPRTEPDPDKLEEMAKRHIIRHRIDVSFNKKEAREKYDLAGDLYNLWHDMNGNSEDFMNAMFKIFGDDWYECMPEKLHHQFEYLCRIVKTVQEALGTLLVQKAA